MFRVCLCRGGGKFVPKHVAQEFEAFLKCGILAHDFLRLRCEDCKCRLVQCDELL